MFPHIIIKKNTCSNDGWSSIIWRGTVAYATEEEKVMLRQGGLEDVRAKRTDKLLQEALMELTVQKGFAAVTVSDLTKYAGINRATFYRHYEDKFDLVNHYARTVYELLDARPDAGLPMPADVSARPAAPGLVAIFDHILANARFYRVMLRPHGDPMFAEKIRHYVKKRIWRSLPAALQRDACAIDLYLSYSSSASIGAVLWWLDHDMPCSAKDMAAISSQVSMLLSTMLGQPHPGGDVKGVRSH
jgi:AcrR family transcriptional regulator